MPTTLYNSPGLNQADSSGAVMKESLLNYIGVQNVRGPGDQANNGATTPKQAWKTCASGSYLPFNDKKQQQRPSKTGSKQGWVLRKQAGVKPPGICSTWGRCTCWPQHPAHPRANRRDAGAVSSASLSHMLLLMARRCTAPGRRAAHAPCRFVWRHGRWADASRVNLRLGVS